MTQCIRCHKEIPNGFVFCVICREEHRIENIPEKPSVKTVELDALVSLPNGETDKWLKERLDEFSEDKEQALFDMLVRTVEVIEQYYSSDKLNATDYLLRSCMKHNRMFIDKLGQ
jgi:hypothetical protein